MTDSEIQTAILDLGRRARHASRELVKLSAQQRNEILCAMAEGLLAAEETVLAANAKDLAQAEANGLTKAMIDRLMLNAPRLSVMAEALRDVARLPDPVGEVLAEWTRPNGLRMVKKRVPIGVIGIIYESRPNVTTDAASLCFKTSNATILRGGSEAFHSNQALTQTLQDSGAKAGLPADSIQLVPFTDRASVEHMARMDQFIDLIIPRGGKGLIEKVVSTARMPVIKHYDGVCHLYVHEDADFDMAVQLTLNSKTQKPGVCNALETLLVHRDAAARFLPLVGAKLQQAGVELRADEEALRYLPVGTQAAEPEDWTAEYLDLILSIKVVNSAEDAVDHINAYGSHHTDVIVCKDSGVAEQFMHLVDSAVVLWNASTRFNDGGEFGFGAEIGISTDKLHARGPMGLPELTSYKYHVYGTGQTRI